MLTYTLGQETIHNKLFEKIMNKFLQIKLCEIKLKLDENR